MLLTKGEKCVIIQIKGTPPGGGVSEQSYKRLHTLPISGKYPRQSQEE